MLSVGFAYPNLVMAENYNASGSPYWAFKAFLPLCLGKEHPFWTAEELPMPKLPAVSLQRQPHMVICRNDADGHVAAFNSGHGNTNEHTHTSAKYEKFVYSTLFGFSVPRAEWGAAQGAYDSMLALSEAGDNLYRVKRKSMRVQVEEQLIRTEWQPWKDVSVTTWLLPGLPWHVRIHRIESGRRLDTVDGGFALGLHEEGSPGAEALAAHCGAEAAFVQNGNGASGIRSLLGNSRPLLVYPQTNTNLLHARTVLPMLQTSVEKGVTWLASAVYGHGAGPSIRNGMPTAPVQKMRRMPVEEKRQ